MQEIKPTYVTFEQAKWLKEKGFDEICLGHYSSDGELQTLQDYLSLGADVEEMINKPFNGISYMKTMCKAPEQWQVIEWLRVNHGIWVYPLPIDDEMKLWQCRIIKGQPFSNLKNTLKIISHGEISYRGLYSPQEAYSAAFDYVLNNNLICKNY